MCSAAFVFFDFSNYPYDSAKHAYPNSYSNFTDYRFTYQRTYHCFSYHGFAHFHPFIANYIHSL